MKNKFKKRRKLFQILYYQSMLEDREPVALPNNQNLNLKPEIDKTTVVSQHATMKVMLLTM